MEGQHKTTPENRRHRLTWSEYHYAALIRLWKRADAIGDWEAIEWKAQIERAIEWLNKRREPRGKWGQPNVRRDAEVMR